MSVIGGVASRLHCALVSSNYWPQYHILSQPAIADIGGEMESFTPRQSSEEGA